LVDGWGGGLVGAESPRFALVPLPSV